MSILDCETFRPALASLAKRRQFRCWLLSHRGFARRLTLRALLTQYGGDISLAAAYRVAAEEHLFALRRNMSRYMEFWTLINWELPDGDLHRIWGVSRSGLRQRRLRTGARSPRFSAQEPITPDHAKLLARETRRARAYDGPRPH